MKADVYSISGSKTGEMVELSNDIFGSQISEHAIYLDVKAYLANQRQGTASSKTRSQVRGGGKKPWKQKGRGVARAGTTRSPVWVGGGRAFGPSPRDYRQKINKKIKSLARRSALADKIANKNFIVIEDFSIASGKTKEMASLLNNFDSYQKKNLFLVADYDNNTVRSAQNIPNLIITRADNFATYEMVNCKRLFIQKGAIARIEEVLS